MKKQMLVLANSIANTLQIIHNKLSMTRLKLLKWGSIGNNVILQPKSTYNCSHNIYIGNDVYIGPHAWISALAKCEVNSGVIIGPRLRIYTANHNFKNPKSLPYDNHIIEGPVSIKENCWIGGDVIILPGVVLEEGCVVGAGSVVTKSFKAGKIIAGNPAREIGQRDMDQYYTLKSEKKIYMRLKSKVQI